MNDIIWIIWYGLHIITNGDTPYLLLNSTRLTLRSNFRNGWYRFDSIVNSHDTKRTHPSRYRLALECQNWRFHILCISFIVCDNSRVLWYIWNVHICSQYQGRVAHFRFTADQKFYPRKFFISASKTPLNFSGGPLKHFWHSRFASARKMHLRGFWHWSAKRNRDC